MNRLKQCVFVMFTVFGVTNLFSQPKIETIRQRQDSVGLYEKFEIDLSIKANYINPFDPAEVDIIATFK